MVCDRGERVNLLAGASKYERIGDDPDAEWKMLLFKNEELISCLNALQVNKSVYEYVQYESDVEQEFAKPLAAGSWRQAHTVSGVIAHYQAPGQLSSLD
jgi:hypothetical protein